MFATSRCILNISLLMLVLLMGAIKVTLASPVPESVLLPEGSRSSFPVSIYSKRMVAGAMKPGGKGLDDAYTQRVKQVGKASERG